MKKVVLNSVLALALIVSVSSCRDTKEGANNAADAVENTADDAAEATEGALESIGKTIDNAVNETKEAGEAVGQAVDTLKGDDNN